jgi:acylphosphatase
MNKQLNNNSKKCLHAIIHGRVQGVGFRFSTIDQAMRLGLTGYASNLYDGTVEVVAEGEIKRLNILLAWLRHGPPMAHVIKVDHRFSHYTGRYKRFSLKY